jgi:3-hydroxybutyrate dehydrogenase
MTADNTKRKVLITGGTGSLGLALISAFSKHGYSICFQYNSAHARADQLKRELGIDSFSIDFSRPFTPPDIDLDIIVNNAGVNLTGAITHEVTDEDWLSTIQINLFAPFFLAKKYLPGMMNRRWGRIINISSIYGLSGIAYNLPYNVSKHGLSGLTRTIAKDYASYGITCNEICPAQIESEMMHQIAAEESTAQGISAEDYLESVRKSIPAQRLASPAEVAALAVFLASDAAAFINGASVPVDGGLLA